MFSLVFPCFFFFRAPVRPKIDVLRRVSFRALMSQILHQKVALKEIRCPIKTKMQEKCMF